ncbi:helix-turn-helix domain-containing protein [Streptomyces rimosus]|uniref:helix-turn-helix domain-containing protein n=1 Tax=Streptomyces rimosus TaxID=1927 RepID=UPI0005186428|nr:helix-turn-helix domain-containing protein [Streptomyces rimosus]
MTIEQPAFGERVREIRRAQGMSQGDLAGDGVSPSYVSLVESGRRSPSTKAAKAIAERLGMSLEELTAPRPADRERTHRLELVGQLVAARASQAAGDWPAARRQLETVAGRAADNDLDEVRWEARWELAAVLDQLGAADDRERVLRTLLDDPLTTAAPLLRSQIAAELSQLHRRQGRLAEAVRRAEDAQSAAADIEAARPARVQAQVALLSAYVESGEWHRAQGLADTLLDEAPSAGAARLRAIALWAAAGARYLDGRADAAHELLTEADELLAATDDVRQRTRLARARTLLALACDAPGADALLERVRQAAALLATPETLSWLAALEVLDALRTSDAERALEQAGTIPVDSPALPALDQARCVLIRARAQRAAGREAAAEADFRTAASGYEAAGAYRLAMATWRELSDPGHLTGPDPHVVLMP